MWNECNCTVIWTFFGIAFLWNWNENWHFQSCGHCCVFQICWHTECSTLAASFFRILNRSAENPSLSPALLIVMLPKAQLTSHSSMSDSRWVTTPSWLSGSLRAFVYSSPLFMEILKARILVGGGLPYLPPGDLPNPGMEPTSHVSCIGRRFFTTSATCLTYTGQKSPHLNPASLRGKIAITQIIWLNSDKCMTAVIKSIYQSRETSCLWAMRSVSVTSLKSPLERAGYTTWGFWWLPYTWCMVMHTVIIYVNFPQFRCEVPSGHFITLCVYIKQD